MELYEQIRREYEFGVGSVIGVARKLGVHRRMVREAVRNAVPAQRKKTERPAVKMAPAAVLIDSILETDRKAPRRQRHTARRIFDRIHAEVPGCSPAERMVRQYVRRRRRELGLAVHEIAEPVLLVGDPGTGKSPLATGLAIAACRQRRRVRFTTAAALVNQLVEAQREQTLSRVLDRWSRVELIVIDSPVWDGNLWGETFAALPLTLEASLILPTYKYDSGLGTFYVDTLDQRPESMPTGNVHVWRIKARLSRAEQVEYTVSTHPGLEIGYSVGPSSQQMGGDCSGVK